MDYLTTTTLSKKKKRIYSMFFKCVCGSERSKPVQTTKRYQWKKCLTCGVRQKLFPIGEQYVDDAGVERVTMF